MRMLTVMIAMLTCGAAFADTQTLNASSELQEIRARITHLNSFYVDLNVKAKKDLQDVNNRAETRSDLVNLEGYLQGDFQLNNAALKTLKCGRPVCDGGDQEQ